MVDNRIEIFQYNTLHLGYHYFLNKFFNIIKYYTGWEATTSLVNYDPDWP